MRDISEERRQSLLATAYHHLGIVAQELREYEEARRCYQQGASSGPNRAQPRSDCQSLPSSYSQKDA